MKSFDFGAMQKPMDYKEYEKYIFQNLFASNRLFRLSDNFIRTGKIRHRFV